MTDQVDHYSEALAAVDQAANAGGPEEWESYTRLAQLNATLALVDAQREANRIALLNAKIAMLTPTVPDSALPPEEWDALIDGLGKELGL